MKKYSKRSSYKVGLPPGTLVHIGEKKIDTPRIQIIDYDVTQFNELEVYTVEDCFPFKDTATITWININGLHDVEIIEKIGTYFDIHPLTLEDILHTGQRPKMEEHESYIFCVMKSLSYNDTTDEIEEEQLSILLGFNFVITFQELEGDEFNPVRERIKNGGSRLRSRKSDYLTYSLIDAVVDNYFIILEKLEEKIEALEDQILNQPTSEIVQTIHSTKRKLISLRKSVWPLRELINGLERTESSLIHDSTLIFLVDVYDHTIQVIDTIESFRDIISGMLDIYLSNVSNKMNEVMKVLTIIATIFIPLTFIAGVYGMNFKFMPELEWRWGYPVVWLIMIFIVIGMFVYFRKKKWF